MSKNLLFCTIGLLVFVSCGPKKPTVAQLREQKHVQDSIALVQQERSLVYYDSLLAVTLPTVDPMLKSFRYEKDDRFEDHGHYVHRLLKTEANMNRNYVQTYVGDDRKTIVRVNYFGTYQLKMKSVRLSSDSLMSEFTGDVYAFTEEGWHEMLTVSGDKAIEFLQFINAYYEKRIQVTLQGEKSKQVFYLSENDKKALMDTYALGVVMNDIYQLEHQIRQTSLQVEKYKKRLGKTIEE